MEISLDSRSAQMWFSMDTVSYNLHNPVTQLFPRKEKN